MKVQDLRNIAITNSLFKPTTLKEAVSRLGFVQADPIRSPARAQDLILRHRVKNYHLNDLETHYRALDLEEDFLYAYGFFAPEWKPLLHPKKKKTLSAFEKKMLVFAKEQKIFHPRDLEIAFGKQTERNWWGGNSKTTKMALDQLHYFGYLRIAGREKGIRTYELQQKFQEELPEYERFKKLTLLIISILEPITETRLTGALNYLRYSYFDRAKYSTKKVVEDLILGGLLTKEKIDGISYLWQPNTEKKAVPQTVKFLTPFDPVVWDRTRFEHLWGWQYRFEAYVPAAKRIRGYYAMPLLWKDDIIGWANIAKDGTPDIGFVDKKPHDKKFDEELEKEVASFKEFLGKAA